MTQYHQINQHLQKILNSQCFAKSVVLKELFRHLLEKSVKGEELKEIEIAYEVFGKKNIEEKERNIRIYVFNLRKKLKEYYEKEGQDDKIVFSIPKGAYEVDIKLNRALIWKNRLAKLAPIFFVVAALFLVLAVFLQNGPKRPTVTKQFIWKYIYESEYPLLIVLGDHYFVQARNSLGNMGATRYTSINSDNDFEAFLRDIPGQRNDFKTTNQTYINKQAPLVMFKFLRFLGGKHLELDMRYSSDLEWEHLENNNTLFIGSYKTQGILQDIFEKTGISFNSKNNKVSYTHNDSTTVYFPDSEEFLTQEFASVIHFQTKDNKTVLAMMCNTDVGNIATAKYLSNVENLKSLKERIRNFPSTNFKAIFEVSGQNQTDFTIHIKRFDPIQIDMNELWP